TSRPASSDSMLTSLNTNSYCRSCILPTASSAETAASTEYPPALNTACKVNREVASSSTRRTRASSRDFPGGLRHLPFAEESIWLGSSVNEDVKNPNIYLGEF